MDYAKLEELIIGSILWENPSLDKQLLNYLAQFPFFVSQGETLYYGHQGIYPLQYKYLMPGWTEHRKWAPLYGLSPKDAEKVDKFLDYPFGMNGPHTHIFHNPIGVALIRVMYGHKAALYAQQHILLDFRNRAIKQLLRELFDVQP